MACAGCTSPRGGTTSDSDGTDLTIEGSRRAIPRRTQGTRASFALAVRTLCVGTRGRVDSCLAKGRATPVAICRLAGHHDAIAAAVGHNATNRQQSPRTNAPQASRNIPGRRVVARPEAPMQFRSSTGNIRSTLLRCSAPNGKNWSRFPSGPPNGQDGDTRHSGDGLRSASNL